MIRDIGILGGLSMIYVVMFATLITVAVFYRKEQRADGSAEHPSDGKAPEGPRIGQTRHRT